MLVPGIITPSQLREAIGGPTKDTRAAGHFTDQMLEDLITRYSGIVVGTVRERLYERGTAGLLVEPVQIDLAEDTETGADVASGIVPGAFFPWAASVVGEDGMAMDYDPDLFQTLEVSPFARRRFYIIGDMIYAIPKTATSVTAYMMDFNRAISEVGGELVVQINERIVAAGREMLAARIQEQSRLMQSEIKE